MKPMQQRWRGALLFIAAAAAVAACSTSKRGLFTKKTAHEQYAARIEDAGLKGTALGSLWFAAAEKALTRPLQAGLPYRENGYFAAEKPDAAGYVFTARRGEQINVQVSIRPADSFLVFIDLWQAADSVNRPSLLASADTATRQLQYEVERDGRYLLRLQPELLRGGAYDLTITTGPSLAFPVPPKAHTGIGSFWGDARDRGGRQHEGIDIFGKFRTPVVAAADGYIGSTQENNLGGKVIFLHPNGKDYTLYYAHLDSQLVRTGQSVQTGDTLGLMGNTGNARHTPTHLHFGIYTRNGAVDPLPFVRMNRPSPPAVTASLDMLQRTARNTAPAVLRASPARNGAAIARLPANQLLHIVAAAGNWYKVALPDRTEGFVESAALSARPYRQQVTRSTAPLLDAPDSTAAVKDTIPAGTDISILGNYKDYRFVSTEGIRGWMK